MHPLLFLAENEVGGRILYAIRRLAAVRWPKVFPFYPILCDFKSLVDVQFRDIAKK